MCKAELSIHIQKDPKDNCFEQMCTQLCYYCCLGLWKTGFLVLTGRFAIVMQLNCNAMQPHSYAMQQAATIDVLMIGHWLVWSILLL